MYIYICVYSGVRKEEKITLSLSYNNYKSKGVAICKTLIDKLVSL